MCKAQVVFVETGSTGDAVITATHGSSASASTTVKVTNIQQAVWVSTKCGGANCTVMGTKGSGFNEPGLRRAELWRVRTGVHLREQASRPRSTFKIHRRGQQAGRRVGAFRPSHPGSPPERSVRPLESRMHRPSRRTCADATRGAFTVKGAEAIPDRWRRKGTPIGSVAVPSLPMHGFSFSCPTVNVAAYTDPVPPREFKHYVRLPPGRPSPARSPSRRRRWAR